METVEKTALSPQMSRSTSITPLHVSPGNNGASPTAAPQMYGATSAEAKSACSSVERVAQQTKERKELRTSVSVGYEREEAASVHVSSVKREERRTRMA